MAVSPIARMVNYITTKIAPHASSEMIHVGTISEDAFERVLAKIDKIPAYKGRILDRLPLQAGETVKEGMVKVGLYVQDALTKPLYMGEESLKKLFQKDLGLDLLKLHWLRAKAYCSSLFSAIPRGIYRFITTPSFKKEIDQLAESLSKQGYELAQADKKLLRESLRKSYRNLPKEDLEEYVKTVQTELFKETTPDEIKKTIQFYKMLQDKAAKNLASGTDDADMAFWLNSAVDDGVGFFD